MSNDEAYHKYRSEQSREWMRRKREADPEGVRAQWRKHAATYRQRHPERVKAAQAAFRAKRLTSKGPAGTPETKSE